LLKTGKLGGDERDGFPSAANANRAKASVNRAGASSAAAGLNGVTVRDAAIAPRRQHPTPATEV